MAETIRPTKKQRELLTFIEEFITEHYWGYSRLKGNKTNEYRVEHLQWKTHPVINYHVDCDFGTMYGKDFDGLNQRQPDSIFFAEGSEIIIRGKKVLL